MNAEINRHFAQAEAARAQGDTPGAVRAMEAALRIDPANPRALNIRAMLAQSVGDLDSALHYYERATAADAQAPELWLNRAHAERQLGRTAAERASLTAALAVDGQFIPARLLRAALEERDGNAAAALADYALALVMLPPDAALPPGLQQLATRAREVCAANAAALAARLDPQMALARVEAPLPRRFERLVDVVTGRNRIYRSVPAVLDYPELPAIEFFAPEQFAWFATLEAATATIRDEYLALFANQSDAVEPYVAYQPGEPVNQWAELNHSTRWGARFFVRDGVPREDVRAACPKTAAVLDSLPLFDLPGRGPAAFFSVLAPHTRIPTHTGATNLRAIVHLPLIVPPGCGFRVGGETRPWTEGQAFAFDDTIEHEAWNDSAAPRVVLILDCWNPAISPRERQLLAQLTGELDRPQA